MVTPDVLWVCRDENNFDFLQRILEWRRRQYSIFLYFFLFLFYFFQPFKNEILILVRFGTNINHQKKSIFLLSKYKKCPFLSYKIFCKLISFSEKLAEISKAGFEIPRSFKTKIKMFPTHNISNYDLSYCFQL